MGQNGCKLLSAPGQKHHDLPLTAPNFIRSGSTLPVKSTFDVENYQPGKGVPVHTMKACWGRADSPRRIMELSAIRSIMPYRQ